MPNTDPIREADDDARKIVRTLIDTAAFGALAVLRDGHPHVSRIAIARDGTGTPVTLISDLSLHTQAISVSPDASLLLGEPGDKGDPLTHPRVTIYVRAEALEKSAENTAGYLQQHPKANLYINFADFHLFRLKPVKGFLNAGFGKAYRLDASDFDT